MGRFDQQNWQFPFRPRGRPGSWGIGLTCRSLRRQLWFPVVSMWTKALNSVVPCHSNELETKSQRWYITVCLGQHMIRTWRKRCQRTGDAEGISGSQTCKVTATLGYSQTRPSRFCFHCSRWNVWNLKVQIETVETVFFWLHVCWTPGLLELRPNGWRLHWGSGVRCSDLQFVSWYIFLWNMFHYVSFMFIPSRLYPKFMPHFWINMFI